MIRRITVITALAFMCAAGLMPVFAQQNGWISRYWDGCKPSCSWADKPITEQWGRVKNCNKNNDEIPLDDQNSKSSCDGGTAYTCWDMVPFVDPTDPNKAYAFAATPSHECGNCFELTFNGEFQHGTAYATHKAIKGKILTVMGSNIGYDVQGGQFDVLIPGGGVGNFDSFSGQLGISSSDLGARAGGFLADCETQLNWGNGTLEQYQKCLRDKCNAVFGSKPAQALLLEGCLFYADWFMAANNPKVTYKAVTCPEILGNRYKVGSGGGVPTPGKTAATIRISTSSNPNDTSKFVGDGDTILTMNIPQKPNFFVHAFDGDGTVFDISSLCENVTWKIDGTFYNKGCTFTDTLARCAAIGCVKYTLTAEFYGKSPDRQPITTSILVTDANVSVSYKAASLTKNGYAINIRGSHVIFTAAEGRKITKLSVLNLKGRKVFGEAGAYEEIKWDSATRPKGMYVVKMTMNNGAVVQRNLLLK